MQKTTGLLLVAALVLIGSLGSVGVPLRSDHVPAAGDGSEAQPPANRGGGAAPGEITQSGESGSALGGASVLWPVTVTGTRGATAPAGNGTVATGDGTAGPDGGMPDATATGGATAVGQGGTTDPATGAATSSAGAGPTGSAGAGGNASSTGGGTASNTAGPTASAGAGSTASSTAGAIPPAASGTGAADIPFSQPSAIPATGPFTPNRLGQIPVLEFHNFGDQDGRWILSWNSFRRVIQTLYDEGFRPVNMVDVVDRHIDLPRGFAPVVLTFDDGDPAQFQWGPQGSGGEPAAHSAVGILTEFHHGHPDWGLRATFYVNRPAFGTDSEAKLRWLVAHGFEVGDHTLDHVPMRQLSAQQVLHEVGGLAAWVQQTVPGYQVSTLAFPDGVNQGLPATTWSGTVDNQSYTIRGAVLVGAGPAPSPFSSSWNPRAIPRIQVVNPDLVKESDRNFIWASWEKRLLANPGRLYVSDGGGS